MAVLTRNEITIALGTSSPSIPSRFGISSVDHIAPVTLPPGRLRLATRLFTGSPPVMRYSIVTFLRSAKPDGHGGYHRDWLSSHRASRRRGNRSPAAGCAVARDASGHPSAALMARTKQPKPARPRSFPLESHALPSIYHPIRWCIGWQYGPDCTSTPPKAR